MKTNISLEAALHLLLDQISPGPSENIPLLKGLNRILGQDIISKENVPDFDRSPLDGYAYIADDAMNASNESPVSLKIAGEIPAGHIPDSKVLPGTAIKISTGAPIPENADVITRYEDTVLNGDMLSYQPT